MPIRVADILPKPGLQFLALCYRFVTVEWQHADREDIPDQGFERRCRECCVTSLGSEWTVSQAREMKLGAGLDTASGIGHEVDIIARHAESIAPVEMKNRAGSPPEKTTIACRIFADRYRKAITRRSPHCERRRGSGGHWAPQIS
jgi:hypothetical protein